MKSKLYIMFAVFLSIFIFLVGRILYIKVCYGKEYSISSINQQTGSLDIAVPASRGKITDRNGIVIAESTPVYNVIFEPATILYLTENNQKDKAEATMLSLSEILGIPYDEIVKYTEKNADGTLVYSPYYQTLAKSVPAETADKIKNLNLSGVWLEPNEKRSYPYSHLASKAIGFTRGETQSGIEKQYNEYLTGKDGRMFKTINGGKIKTEYIEPENGNTIVSTIDINIQKAADECVKEITESFPCETASALVMDPKTGEILAMADSNDFDLNNPSTPVGMAVEEFNALTPTGQSEYLNGMWRNYNISSTFEPGSIFKPLITAAALDEKTINENSTFYCQGYKQVADRRIHCIRRSGHGNETLEEALSSSCNCAMMDIADIMGKSIFYKYQIDFGFGSKTGIDLPGEESASSLVYPEESLGPVELATSSFGQSFNATPLQSLTALCAIANGGQILKPYTVSKIISPSGSIVKEFKPEIKRTVISEESCRKVTQFMVSVVEKGTGKKAKIDGYKIAAKSGTGQQQNRSDGLYTITFAGFFPADDPEIAALVVMDKPFEYADGVTTAAPAFKNMAEKIIKYKKIEPEVPEISSIQETKEQSISISDFTSKSLSEAESQLISLGLKYEVIGNGKIVLNQFPKGGSKAKTGTEILLYT